MLSDGNSMRPYTLPCAAVLCVIVLSLVAVSSLSAHGASGDGAADPDDFSFSGLMAGWGSAMVDPDTYTTWMHIDGFSSFMMNETFFSAFSSSTYGSLDRDSILGTIPNIFFVVCIIVVILSVAVAVLEIKKLERSKRVVRK
ncbi:MAG: hypothetical protein FWH44_04940 [Methanomassiliicoccaceae archaeon]|nr:hypothetical protein [Methanomassiliicoccaceae archaeon]